MSGTQAIGPSLYVKKKKKKPRRVYALNRSSREASRLVLEQTIGGRNGAHGGARNVGSDFLNTGLDRTRMRAAAGFPSVPDFLGPIFLKRET